MNNNSNRSVQIYSDYYGQAATRAFRYVLPPAEEVDRMIRKESIVAGRDSWALDYGCGEGRNSLHLSQLGYSVLATDVSKGTIEATRKRTSGEAITVRLIPPGDTLPAQDASIDLILAFEVLHWLGSNKLFEFYLNEFSRVLKPEGNFVFTMPTEVHFLKTRYANEVEENVFLCHSGSREHCVLFSPPLHLLKNLLDRNGFRISRLMRYDRFEHGAENDLTHPFSMYCLNVKPR